MCYSVLSEWRGLALPEQQAFGHSSRLPDQQTGPAEFVGQEPIVGGQVDEKSVRVAGLISICQQPGGLQCLALGLSNSRPVVQYLGDMLQAISIWEYWGVRECSPS